MSSGLAEAAAQQLRTAADTGVPCAPVRGVLGTSTDTDVAYGVQQRNVALALAAGRRVSGHKVGLTARVVQEQLGVDQPDYGVLFADMCLTDGAEVNAGRLLQPRVEAEVTVGTRPVSLHAVDLREIQMRMTIDGETAATGTGAACLGNPLNAAVWLADVMCERGTPLRAGECLMTGSLGPMRPIRPGAEVFADLSALGTVSTRLIA